jgi:hypothetical protein
MRIPSYRLHKASGQAVVVLGGVSHYLGKHNSPESLAEYEQVLSEWLAAGRRSPPAATPDPVGTPEAPLELTVGELLLAHRDFAKTHYRHADGTPTREQDNIRDAVRPVRRLYERLPAREFGPLALRAVQQEMIRAGLARRVINDRIKRIRRVFRWAVSMEMIPPAVVQALETVQPLRRGRCDARESPGVRPVKWTDVDAVIPHLPTPVAAMVQIMRYSNCRAEDAVAMRGCDLRMEGDVWEYRPANHKNSWREEEAPQHAPSFISVRAAAPR